MSVLTQSEVIDKVTKVLQKMMLQISTKIEKAVDSSGSSNRIRELYSQLQQLNLVEEDKVNITNYHDSIRRLDDSFGCYYETYTSGSSYKGTFIDSDRVVISSKFTHGCTSSSYSCLMHVREVYDVSSIDHSTTSSGYKKYTLTLTSINKKLSGVEFSQYDINYYRSYYQCNIYQRFYTYQELYDSCIEIQAFVFDLFDSYVYSTVSIIISSGSCSCSGLSISSGISATPSYINSLISMITIVSYPISDGIMSKNIQQNKVEWDLNGKSISVYYLNGDEFSSYSIGSSSSSSSVVHYSNYSMIDGYYYFRIPGNDKVCKSSSMPFLFNYHNLPCSSVSQPGSSLKQEIMRFISNIYGSVINVIYNGDAYYDIMDYIDYNTDKSVNVSPITFFLLLTILIFI